MKALLSVYDKAGIVEFVQALHQMGIELISTGGTHRTLTQEARVPVQQVSELTSFPEILDGRVKTLHPLIHGGLLARRDLPQHMEELAKHGISTIDLVAVNLYPFVETVQKPQVTLEEALENIDIGGPTLLRAAAKNFPSVIVVVDPNDYSWIAERLASNGVSQKERQNLAYKAFHHVSCYDAAVAQYLSDKEEELPPTLGLAFDKVQDLRYGENPHQKGALYSLPGETGGVARAQQLHGRELSFNNLMDAHAAWEIVQEFSEPAVAVIKHTNPCGLACHPDLAEAYRRAYSGDPVSAFGGILGFNRTVTTETAREVGEIFYEVVIAPDYEHEALELLRKKRNLRLLAISHSEVQKTFPDLRPISGGLLVQTPDVVEEDPSSWKVTTSREPTEGELADLAFAWLAAKHIKSNAIVLAKERTQLGMGAGQPNRVTSVHLALKAAEDRAQGSVLASDAFFPFPDSIDMAAQGGVTAIVQPGGSIRDDEVIEAANRHNMAMVFTGIRHFKH